MTADAAGKNGAIEAGISQFVSWRKFPMLCLGIQRQRRLEHVVALRQECAKSVLTCPDDPSHFASVAKKFPSVGTRLGFGLIKLSISRVNCELQIVVFIFDGTGGLV